jgi:hypothetical protein
MKRAVADILDSRIRDSQKTELQFLLCHLELCACVQDDKVLKEVQELTTWSANGVCIRECRGFLKCVSVSLNVVQELFGELISSTQVWYLVRKRTPIKISNNDCSVFVPNEYAGVSATTIVASAISKLRQANGYVCLCPGSFLLVFFLPGPSRNQWPSLKIG